MCACLFNIISLFMIPGICKTRLRYHSSGHQVSVSLNPCTVVWLTPPACLLFDQQSQEEIRATPELCLLIVVAVFTSFVIEVVLILLCCSQHSLTLDPPLLLSCNKTNIQILFNWTQIIENKLFSYGSATHQAWELQFFWDGCSCGVGVWAPSYVHAGQPH